MGTGECRWNDRTEFFHNKTPEQNILHYEVAVGMDKQYCTQANIVPFTNLGLATGYTFANLQLIPMTQEYYVTVKAHSVSMATAEATSNGIIAGYIHSILPGMVTVTPYQSEMTTLTAQSDAPMVLSE